MFPSNGMITITTTTRFVCVKCIIACTFHAPEDITKIMLWTSGCRFTVPIPPTLRVIISIQLSFTNLHILSGSFAFHFGTERHRRRQLLSPPPPPPPIHFNVCGFLFRQHTHKSKSRVGSESDLKFISVFRVHAMASASEVHIAPNNFHAKTTETKAKRN